MPKKYTSRLPFWLGIFTILLLTFYFSIGITRYFFFGSHDGDYNLIRAFTALLAFKEGQFPLFWTGTLNQLCGAPLPTTHYPLLSYLAILVAQVIPLPLPRIITYIFATSLPLGGLGMYLLFSRHSKSVFTSFVGATLYSLSPYFFVNLYVRGTTEVFGYALAPWIFLLINLVFQSTLFFPLLVLIWLLFILSHNLVFLFFLPFILLYLFCLSRKHKTSSLGLLILLVFSLTASFFWLPALVFQPLLQLSITPAIDYQQHFPSLRQLLYSPWGFFYQTASPSNKYPSGINFSLGIAQWLLLAITVISLKLKPYRRLKLSLLALTLLTIFFISYPSRFLWNSFTPLQIIQFPWRLLGLAIFFISVLTVITLSSLPKSLRIIVGILLLSFAIIGNRNHHLPTPLMDESFYHNLNYHPVRYTTTTIADEVIHKNSLRACKASDPFVTGSSIQGSSAEIKESSGQISYSSSKQTDHDLALRLMYFPGIYRFQVNNQPISEYSESQGLVLLKDVSSQKGLNQISWTIHPTPTHRLAYLLTLVGFALTLIYPIIRLLNQAKLSRKTKSQS